MITTVMDFTPAKLKTIATPILKKNSQFLVKPYLFDCDNTEYSTIDPKYKAWLDKKDEILENEEQRAGGKTEAMGTPYTPPQTKKIKSKKKNAAATRKASDAYAKQAEGYFGDNPKRS